MAAILQTQGICAGHQGSTIWSENLQNAMKVSPRPWFGVIV